MKTLVITSLLMLLAVAAMAQTTDELPANFAGAGLGFQSAANPQTSGWAEACHRNPDVKLFGLTLPSYMCAATDYAANATSARVDIDTVFLHKAWFAGGSKTGGGAAVNTNGVGGSYAVGGWAAADISKFLKIDGVRLVGSITWQKDDVAAATKAGAVPLVLQALGARAVVRCGFGKTW